MKRNVSKLNKGEENSSIGIKENKIIHEQTQINNKKITLDKINQFNRTQSQMLPSFHKTKKIKKIRKIPKFQIESGKPHCLLYRIRKINPEINLNYQIELYQKKQRYSVTKKDEMIDESKHGRKFFERENFKEDYVYEPSLSNRLESNKFYLKNKKSISKKEENNILDNKPRESIFETIIKGTSKNISKFTEWSFNSFQNINQLRKSYNITSDNIQKSTSSKLYISIFNLDSSPIFFFNL